MPQTKTESSNLAEVKPEYGSYDLQGALENAGFAVKISRNLSEIFRHKIPSRSRKMAIFQIS